MISGPEWTCWLLFEHIYGSTTLHLYTATHVSQQTASASSKSRETEGYRAVPVHDGPFHQSSNSLLGCAQSTCSCPSTALNGGAPGRWCRDSC